MDAADQEIARLVEAEFAAEACRAAAHAREAARHRGVTWSACGPDAFVPTPGAELLGRARRLQAGRSAWRETAAGRFAKAVAEGQRIAGAAHQACERARAAWSRDFAGEAGACLAAAVELENLAQRLADAARRARGAAASTLPSERGCGARTAPPPDAPG